MAAEKQTLSLRELEAMGLVVEGNGLLDIREIYVDGRQQKVKPISITDYQDTNADGKPTVKTAFLPVGSKQASRL